jgi:hypothetical protein
MNMPAPRFQRVPDYLQILSIVPAFGYSQL